MSHDLPDKTVISHNEAIAAMNTIRRECLMAMMAAMKNVLSPSSETRITDKDAIKEWRNPRLPLFLRNA